MGARGGLGRLFTSMVTNFLHTVRIELSLCVMLMRSDDVNEEQHFITQLYIARFMWVVDLFIVKVYTPL